MGKVVTIWSYFANFWHKGTKMLGSAILKLFRTRIWSEHLLLACGSVWCSMKLKLCLNIQIRKVTFWKLWHELVADPMFQWRRSCVGMNEWNNMRLFQESSCFSTFSNTNFNLIAGIAEKCANMHLLTLTGNWEKFINIVCYDIANKICLSIFFIIILLTRENEKIIHAST